MIENQIKGLTQKQVVQWLNDNAEKIEEGEYFKSFDNEELQASQIDYSNLSLKYNRLEKDLEEVKANFKFKMAPLKEEMKEILSNIAHNGETVEGKQFLFANQESGMMEYYNALGQLVSSRRLKPEERQLNILSINSKAQ